MPDLRWLLGEVVRTHEFTNPMPYHRNVSHDPGKELEIQLEQLVQGRILFNPPERMDVGEESLVEVRISRNITDDIGRGLLGKGKIELHDVQIGPFMTVKLNGGEAFEVKNRTPEDQFISPRDYTQWSYDVKALNAGTQTLFLAVGIRIKFEHGGEEKRFYPLYEKRIDVHVNVARSISEFWNHNWQWLGSAILIPLLAATIRVWWKLREDERTERRIVDPKDDDISKVKL
jgi:hypothetical protein